MQTTRTGLHPIADTIFQQFGGFQACRLIGAKKIIGIEKGLKIVYAAQSKCGDGVMISLRDDDTYIMVFYSVKKAEILKTIEDVYCDQLQDLFEETTGLYLTLFPRRK